MGQRKRLITVIVLVIVTIIGLLLISFYTKHATLDKASGWLTFIGAFLAIPALSIGLYPLIKGETGIANKKSIDDEAHKFSLAVQRDLSGEYSRRRAGVPASLTVQWTQCDASLLDDPRNIYGGLPGHRLQRSVTIERRYSALPRRRLIVLGRAGSGKSVLVMQLALALLEKRTDAEPVPVLFNIRTWNAATTPLRDWLITDLARMYKQLRTLGPNDVNLAQEFVDRELIIPILDGYDELAPELHSAAIERVNYANHTPMILTSRSEEFEAAVRQNGAIEFADGIHMKDISIDDLEEYLPTGVGPRNPHDEGVWADFLLDLRTAANTDPLRIVLTTPLNAFLLRKSYLHASGPDPRELFDRTQFSTADAIESHLFSTLIEATFRGTSSKYRPAQVNKWLGRIASGLQHQNKHSFGWWEIRDTFGRLERSLVCMIFGCIGGTMALWPLSPWFGAGIGIGTGVGVSVNSGGPLPSVFRLKYPARGKLLVNIASALLGSGLGAAGCALFVPSRGLVTRYVSLQGVFSGSVWPMCGGLVLGVVLGLADSFAKRRAVRQQLPKDRSTRLNHAFTTFLWGFLSALLGGVALGYFAGLTFGVIAGGGAGIVASFEGFPDLDQVPSMETSLRTDRLTSIAKFFGFGSLVGVTVGVLSSPAGWRSAAVLGLAAGVANGGGVSLGMNAWGHWLILSRFWAALTVRMPWNVTAFLEETHEKGVLRQLGGVYQFRHSRLQEALAAGYKRDPLAHTDD